jgi:hypothetical protein
LAQPWLTEIREACQMLLRQALPKSATGKAVAYTLIILKISGLYRNVRMPPAAGAIVRASPSASRDRSRHPGPAEDEWKGEVDRERETLTGEWAVMQWRRS